MRRRIFFTVIACLLLFAALATQVAADIGNSADDLRDGWYPDEPSLTPQLVGGGTFGRVWTASVDGQVYAQPLLSNGTLVVATENDVAYGLDPATGAQQWSDTLATPWDPAAISCADITPSIGTTSTPAIDPATNTVYLTYKTYASGTSGPAAWYLDALDVSTGARRPGFPVELDGTAQNDPSASFNATDQQQRPGLLLMNGVVYAAFGSHCDYSSWQGWIFGVSTAGEVTARWVDDDSGGGIWQSGTGLMSDGSGSLMFVTGNGNSPTSPGPGNAPPSQFGDAVVHLAVQGDGSLRAVDYFMPFDAQQLDRWDEDFGSGGIVGLPDGYFGTAAIPHLAVTVGKEGYVYLLNRDALGGYDQGAGGGDAVVQRLGPRGGVYGRPGVWPGDGGYVYITTTGGPLDVYRYGLSGTGQPSLSLVGSSADTFGWGSGPAVVTSNGVSSGSAVVWVIWSADRAGDGGELRAYDPIPVNGQPQLLWSAPIGLATNYSVPGVGDGRIYVGTRDGSVIAFGSGVTPSLSAPALGFPATTIGSTSALTLTLTADRDVTVSGLASSSSQFELGTPSQTLPATLRAGETLSVPVTFAPSATGTLGGEIDATLAGGASVPFSVTGLGQSVTPQLTVSQGLVSLGGTTVGGELTGSLTLTNDGASPLRITAVDPPGAPFSATGLPSVGGTIAPGGSANVTLAFDPTAAGAFQGTLEVDSNGGDQLVGLSGSAAAPGRLELSSESVDFGSLALGESATRSFTITNTGGSTVTISKSKPPYGGAFAALTTLEEGATIAPGASVTETVTFTPTAAGSASGAWLINSDDGQGLRQVLFTGTGTAPAPPPSPGGAGGSTPAPAITTTPITTTPATTTPGPAGSTDGAAPVVLRSPSLLPHTLTRATLRRARLRFSLTAPATVRIAILRAQAGRRVGGRCAGLTRRDRRRARCTRYVIVATFHLHAHGGVNRVALSAHVSPAALRPGSYRLEAVVASASASAAATRVSARFRVVLLAAGSRAGRRR